MGAALFISFSDAAPKIMNNGADTRMATEALKTIRDSWNITELAEHPAAQQDMSFTQAGTMAVSTIWIIVSAWLLIHVKLRLRYL